MSDVPLVGEWVHAHERDHEGWRVYVPADHKLPPSRGRRRLEFNPNGTFRDGQPGSDDRTSQSTGRYEVHGSEVVLHQPGAERQLTYEAVSKTQGAIKTLELKLR